MIESIYYYTRIAGTLLFFSFGTVSGVILLQNTLTDNIQEQLRTKGVKSFAGLKRGQAIRSPSGTHYYYTYTGVWGKRVFEAIEEVDARYFHTVSEGANVPILILVDKAGRIHSRLSANNRKKSEEIRSVLLINISLVISAGGLLLLLISLLLGRLVAD